MEELYFYHLRSDFKVSPRTVYQYHAYLNKDYLVIIHVLIKSQNIIFTVTIFITL